MPKEEAFLKLVNAAASQKGCEFFISNGEGRSLETDTLVGEDLFGWLIPAEKVAAFQKEFQTGDISERWSSFMCFAFWHLSGDVVTINFKKY